MKTNLTPSWELSTENAASSYGQPVLVNRTTGEAYGPGDILKPYPSYGFMAAADAVRRMAKTKKMDEDGQNLVDKFTKLAKAAKK